MRIRCRNRLNLSLAAALILCLVAVSTAPAPAAEGPQAGPTMHLASSDALAGGGPAGEPAEAGQASQQGGESAAADLAKASQNPVADLISLPIQHNFNFKTGPGDDVLNIMNIQPVIPVRLNEDWNLINRLILPIIWQPEMAPGMGIQNGLGDIQYTAFFSPAKSEGLVWGLGPVFQFASATDERLGSERYSAGPSAVFLVMDGPWVVGALLQNVWSYAGDGDREDVNQFLMQPFVNYNLPGGWYLSTAPNITANWETHGTGRWTVPVGGGVGRVFKIGKQPVNLSVRAYYNVVRPDNGPDWSVQVQLTLLFPK